MVKYFNVDYDVIRVRAKLLPPEELLKVVAALARDWEDDSYVSAAKVSAVVSDTIEAMEGDDPVDILNEIESQLLALATDAEYFRDLTGVAGNWHVKLYAANRKRGGQ